MGFAFTLLCCLVAMHVSLKLMSRDLSDGQELITLHGDTLTVSISDNGVVTINGASVIIPDLEASNGVVHVIGSVLLPPGSLLPSTVVDVATDSTDFSTLVAALEAADLSEALSNQGPFTVFAPSDAAFAIAISALGTTAEELLASEGLGDILMYHVVPGKVRYDSSLICAFTRDGINCFARVVRDEGAARVQP